MVVAGMALIQAHQVDRAAADQWAAQLTQQLPGVQLRKAQAVAQRVMAMQAELVLEEQVVQILLAAAAVDAVRSV